MNSALLPWLASAANVCSTLQPMKPPRFLSSFILTTILLAHTVVAGPLKIAPFSVDITPPLGSMLAYNEAKHVDDPLYARGIAIFSDQKPVVLCAVDHIGISNGGQDEWRAALAKAVDTTPDRVAVHSLHQHDAPRCDFTKEAIMESVGLGGKSVNLKYARRIIAEAAAALRASAAHPRTATHLGVGKGRVERVASNRRVLGPDGKVKYVRWSGMPRTAANIPAIQAPEGLIDPWMRLISFWDGDKPVASLTWYATHPQSYYRQGGISADFPGLARAYRDREEPGVVNIHFNGAGGNVAAGKYNDKSPAARYFLSNRVAEGMRQAWNSMKKVPIDGSQLDWRIKTVHLPLNDRGEEKNLEATLKDLKAQDGARISAASELAYLRRVRSGRGIVLQCLRLGDAYVLHMPGELFVEYQLWAQEMRPDDFVCMAAYGEYSPGYIGTKIAYTQGGYETSQRASRTTGEAEGILLGAMRELLGAGR